MKTVIFSLGMKPAKCEVCFAGSVMAFSLDVAFEDDVFPGELDVDEDTRDKLDFLDDCRSGHIYTDSYDFIIALRGGRTIPDIIRVEGDDIVDYEDNADAFKEGMWTLAAEFQKHGL